VLPVSLRGRAYGAAAEAGARLKRRIKRDPRPLDPALEAGAGLGGRAVGPAAQAHRQHRVDEADGARLKRRIKRDPRLWALVGRVRKALARTA
jgi:hypothetical protein